MQVKQPHPMCEAHRNLTGRCQGTFVTTWPIGGTSLSREIVYRVVRYVSEGP